MGRRSRWAQLDADIKAWAEMPVMRWQLTSEDIHNMTPEEFDEFWPRYGEVVRRVLVVRARKKAQSENLTHE